MRIVFVLVGFLGLVGLLLFTSCGGADEECVSSMKIGDAPLDAESIPFQPYQGGESLIFEDLNGVQLNANVVQLINTTSNPLYAEFGCREALFQGFDNYYDGEYQELEIVIGDDLLKVLLTIQVTFTGSPTAGYPRLLFDFFSLKAFHDLDGVLLELMTSARGNENDQAFQLQTDDLRQNYQYFQEIDLNGAVYTDVYAVEEVISLYFQPGKGLVGFNLEGTLYTLQ